jgi:hypothetical protein
MVVAFGDYFCENGVSFVADARMIIVDVALEHVDASTDV